MLFLESVGEQLPGAVETSSSEDEDGDEEDSSSEEEEETDSDEAEDKSDKEEDESEVRFCGFEQGSTGIRKWPMNLYKISPKFPLL